MESPFIQHLLVVSHNMIMAELLEARDRAHELLVEYGHRNLPAMDELRTRLKAVDTAYADMSERLR